MPTTRSSGPVAESALGGLMPRSAAVRDGVGAEAPVQPDTDVDSRLPPPRNTTGAAAPTATTASSVAPPSIAVRRRRPRTAPITLPVAVTAGGGSAARLRSSSSADSFIDAQRGRLQARVGVAGQRPGAQAGDHPRWTVRGDANPR